MKKSFFFGLFVCLFSIVVTTSAHATLDFKSVDKATSTDKQAIDGLNTNNTSSLGGTK